jgi:hypothetical protein
MRPPSPVSWPVYLASGAMIVWIFILGFDIGHFLADLSLEDHSGEEEQALLVTLPSLKLRANLLSRASNDLTLFLDVQT